MGRSVCGCIAWTADTGQIWLCERWTGNAGWRSPGLKGVTPGYAIFDLRAGFELQRDWLLKLGLENIGDRPYINHLNTVNPFNGQRIPEVGRNFYVTKLGTDYSFTYFP